MKVEHIVVARALNFYKIRHSSKSGNDDLLVFRKKEKK